jgi:hypothetical protein
MPFSSATHPTLLDFARREGFDGKIAAIIESSAQTNEMIEDMVWQEGNLTIGNKTTIRTGYPTPTWRLLNYGVQPTKSTTRQVVDTCGMLEDYAEVDKSLADLNGNTAEWRASEDRAHLIGMSETLSSAVLYGNQAVDPEKITGLAPRFCVPSATDGVSGFNMIDGGAVDGQTDTTSIWMVAWGPQTVFGMFPKGSKAGWSYEDKGQVTLYDTNNGRYEGYRTHYKWDCGLVVRDWKAVVRIPNIDVSTLTVDFATGPNLVNLLTMGSERLSNAMKLGNAAIYCNRTIRSALRLHMRKTAASQITWDMVAGKHVLAFDGIPVRRVDAITNAETAILDAAGTFASW